MYESEIVVRGVREICRQRLNISHSEEGGLYRFGHSRNAISYLIFYGIA
jgi:hypothetical protein